MSAALARARDAIAELPPIPFAAIVLPLTLAPFAILAAAEWLLLAAVR